MSVFLCDTFYEDTPTLDDVKHEIYSIVGLPEIKKQLEVILGKIIDAEKDAMDGFRVVPPKPLHMVFIGNNGTGKSKEGGVLLVNIDDEDPINPKTLEEIIATMDEGETSIILAGNLRALNQYMKSNHELYRRFSARLQFDDLTCEDLAMILQKKARDRDENDLLCGFELDASCCTDNISEMIAELAPENVRRSLNAHLLDQMLIEAKKVAHGPGEKTISLRDLGIGIQNGAIIYKKLLNL